MTEDIKKSLLDRARQLRQQAGQLEDQIVELEVEADKKPAIPSPTEIPIIPIHIGCRAQVNVKGVGRCEDIIAERGEYGIRLRQFGWQPSNKVHLDPTPTPIALFPHDQTEDPPVFGDQEVVVLFDDGRQDVGQAWTFDWTHITHYNPLSFRYPSEEDVARQEGQE